MEYYSALNWKKNLTHASTWMKLEDIMLNEISQLQEICWNSTYVTF